MADTQASLVQRFFRSPLAPAVAGAGLLWLAQPGTLSPLGTGISFGWIAWFAPAPWVWLILTRERFGRGRYAQLWLAGWVYWMLTLHWIRLPHPLTPIGWPLLCGYFACYLPVFIAVCRAISRRTVAPAWIVAPIVWVALEYAQAHLFTGFQLGALSHTQAAYPLIIQIAELGGGYAVSLLLMLTAASLAFALRRDICGIRQLAALGCTIAVVCGAVFYGQTGLRDGSPRPGPTIALVQGRTLALWDDDPDRSQNIMNAQTALTQQASRRARKAGMAIDLIVWPESMFRVPIITMQDRLAPAGEIPSRYRPFVSSANDWLTGLATAHNAALLVGADRFDVSADESLPKIYNAALLVNRQGQTEAIYDKMHRVPFGEYIPLAKNLPALYFLTPMQGGLGEGAGPVAMQTITSAGPITLCPSICYESVLPHVIQQQVAQLSSAGRSPNLLVNLTNDAWFWGASELDLHLACAVFRAVENRTPMVVAANTGLSAMIDSCGRIRQVSQRMQEDVLVDAVALDDRTSFYSQHGDWFALGCLAVTVWLLAIALLHAERPAACRLPNASPTSLA